MAAGRVWPMPSEFVSLPLRVPRRGQKRQQRKEGAARRGDCAARAGAHFASANFGKVCGRERIAIADDGAGLVPCRGACSKGERGRALRTLLQLPPRRGIYLRGG